ncbi:MAG TPA: hypothetical protein VJC18_06730 [bacterium]|nr:hypothetical protein [bacterium]
MSNATVTKWFKQADRSDFVNIETKSLFGLARGLGVDVSIFLSERRRLQPLQTSFLWDNLFPNMETFVKAVVQKRLPALARLVEVLGLRNASLVAGDVIYKKFSDYKKFIKPVRRQQMEVLCQILYQP